MRPSFLLAPLVLAAACGSGGGITVRGDFPDSASAAGSVAAMEAGQDVEVADRTFELAGLSPGPATLHLLRGADTVGTLAIHNLPAGSDLSLHRLRTDPASGLAFPAEVTLRGARVVMVNGLRMGPPGALPGEVDEAGRVLSRSATADALLLRPDDARLPDLRVIVSPATDVVTADGDPVEMGGLAAGDSVRVEGSVESGFVIASRLTVPRRLAPAVSDVPVEGSAPRGDGDEASSAPSPPFVVVPTRPAPRVRDAVREPPARGRARGRDRGEGRGRGKKEKG